MELLTVRRAAERLGVTVQYIYLLRDEGKIESRKVLDRIVIPDYEIDRLLEKKSVAP